jgi:epoxyqueuosine reductase
MSLTAGAIKAKAREIGFDLCGIARADAYPELAYFAEWLARGYAGRMQYLIRTARRRADVRHVLPSARSVIVLGTNYHVDRPYSVEISDPGEALIARYARGDDYHAVLARRLDTLLAWMREASGEPFEVRAYTDTGPVQERAYAQRAGLGWIGKNTCLINPEIGSWIFLSEILCSLELEADEPAFDRCGACSLCLEACPTGAIVEPRVLDATRCLSYLTIELRGEIPDPWRDRIGARIFGCDICQEVCPWNQSPPVSRDPAWQPRPALDRPRLADLAGLDDVELARVIHGTALTRAGVAGLRRNLQAALGAIEPKAHERPPRAGPPAGDGPGADAAGGKADRESPRLDAASASGDMRSERHGPGPQER